MQLGTAPQRTTDEFVQGILDDTSPREGDRFLAKSDSHTSGPMMPSTPTMIDKPRYDTLCDSSEGSSPHTVVDVAVIQRAQTMFRYSLVFINFTFVVAAMLLIMAGIVARENSAVKLCEHCGELTLVAIIFGVMLWLFALFGFNWIRQRNILFLLVYVAFLLALVVALLGVLITAGVFDLQVKKQEDGDGNFLAQWMESVNATSSNGESPLCQLQRIFNCSGFGFGCCKPLVCFNVTPTPTWVAQVCPNCGSDFPSDRPCTSIVYSALRRNLGGFLVISCFSMLLILTGVLLAALSRKVNQSI